ncbi:MAG: hypothetical protein RL637_1594 [Pseudomonadota bacterium]|jgi:23S rRNA (pseudouridine1915-N3)-methyltransferase
MQIHLISIGDHLPIWIQQGYQEYAKRLPKECELILKEIPALKRGKNADIHRIIHQEGEKMLAALPNKAHKIILDLAGQSWSTPQLAAELKQWLVSGQNIALFIGGAEGLSPTLKAQADQAWCLSALTFPHPLVRVIVAEQLYRAWSLLNHHPYHR